MPAAPHEVRTACTRDCPDACQILATVEDGRITRLRGDPAHPMTRGFLCYRTDHYLERQYSPERLTEPLIRKGGTLVPASWEEALDLVAERLREALGRGPETILSVRSGGSLGLVKMVNRHFFELLGPVTHTRGDICSGAGEAAQVADMGVCDAHDLEDLENSRAIVLWGKNVAETGVHLLPVLKRARARGVPVVQIDPIHNARTLQVCDRHYAVRPGGDGFLALGVARVLLDEGLADPDVASYTDGLDAFAALARRHTVDEWAARADLPASAVREIAALLGGRKPAAIFVGWGLGRRLHGSATVRLIDALGAISGNLGVPGGGVSYYFARRVGFDTSWVKRAENAGARTLLEPLLGEEILRADPPIQVAIVDNGNPVSQLPESSTVARGLASVGFLVVIDAFLTDTAELAHVVLPTTTMLEEHDVVGAYGHHWVQLSQPVVEPPAGVRSDLEIYQALARRLGFGEALAAPAEAWVDRLLAPMGEAGVTREALGRRALRKPRAPRVLFEGRRFPTANGRFQLVGEFPDAPDAREEGYPLCLMSNSSYKNQASQIPRSAQQGVPEVTLHPDAAPGRADGEEATLASPLAEVRVRLRFDPEQRRDVVVYAKGRWGKFGGPNALIRARETDAGGGAAYYDQGVRIV